MDAEKKLKEIMEKKGRTVQTFSQNPKTYIVRNAGNRLPVAGVIIASGWKNLLDPDSIAGLQNLKRETLGAVDIFMLDPEDFEKGTLTWL